jgi:hypothetical protein
MIPDFLTHYYEASRGPFRSLTALDPAEADRRQAALRQMGIGFASQRAADYLDIRRGLEQTIRALFVAKGGHPQRDTPHYLILGACDWVKSWYADGREVRVPLAAFDPCTVSLTVGDSFPAMRYGDGKPWRGQVFTLDELPEIVRLYGLPQDWNPDGKRGPDRYIEAQVWADEPLKSLGWLENS